VLLIIMMMMMMLWYCYDCCSCGCRPTSFHQFAASRGSDERQRHPGVGTGDGDRTPPSSKVVRGGTLPRGAAAATLGAPGRATHHRHALHGPGPESRTTIQVPRVRRDAGRSDWIALRIRAAAVRTTSWRYMLTDTIGLAAKSVSK